MRWNASLRGSEGEAPPITERTDRSECQPPQVNAGQGHHFFDREAKATIQLLEALRQQVGRSGHCDVELFEGMQAVREAVEIIRERVDESPAYSIGAMPQIYQKASGGKAGKAAAVYKQGVRGASKPKRRRPPGSGLSSHQTSTQLASTTLAGSPDEARGGSVAEQSLERRSAELDGSTTSHSTTPWLDLVRPVPEVSMKDLCRNRVSLNELLGSHQRSSSTGPERGEHEPQRPATSSSIGKAPCSGRRYPPRAPQEPFSKRPGPRAWRQPRQSESLPPRPATSYDICGMHNSCSPPPDSPPRSRQELFNSEAGAKEALHPARRGELHVEIYVEVHPVEGECEARQALMELQICGDAWPDESYPPPASMNQLVVAGSSEAYGVTVLEVQAVDRADLRLALIGASSHEASRIPIARLLAEVPADLAPDQPAWVPLQWAVDDRRTVHLRAAFQPYIVESTCLPPLSPPLSPAPAARQAPRPPRWGAEAAAEATSSHPAAQVAPHATAGFTAETSEPAAPCRVPPGSALVPSDRLNEAIPASSKHEAPAPSASQEAGRPLSKTPHSRPVSYMPGDDADSICSHAFNLIESMASAPP